ncbi:hypothetical protein CHUAL_002814 [Chamberlinius hualienensis]
MEVNMASEQCAEFILPCDNRTKVKLLLLTNVTNCNEIKKEVRAGKIDACLLRNSLIIDELQVQVATNMAVNAKNLNQMKTRNIFTEIIYFMSCSRNISDSLTKFSVQDNDTSLLAIIIDDDEENRKVSKLLNQVKGQLTSHFDQLKQLSDIDEIKKIYKIKTEESELELTESVVSRISTKEIATF